MKTLSQLQTQKETLEKQIKALQEKQAAKAKDYKMISGYKAACKYLKEKERTLKQFDFLPKEDQLHAFADHKLTIIIRAVCKILNWKPDWKNSGQYKYFCWFDLSSGSGLSSFTYDFWHSISYVGSRLCLPDEETANYVGKTFTNEFKEWML